MPKSKTNVASGCPQFCSLDYTPGEPALGSYRQHLYTSRVQSVSSELSTYCDLHVSFLGAHARTRVMEVMANNAMM